MIDRLIILLKPSIIVDRVGNPIGRDGRIRVHTFIDFLTPVHDFSFLSSLSDFFVEYLKENCKLDTIDSIVGPKRGNTILIKNCADKLEKNSSFIRDTSLFDKRIEGKIKPSERVLLIDDVGSDGELLSDCVKHLRNEGVFVQDVVVLINRKEGDVKERLNSIGIEYKFVAEFDDQELVKIS